MLAIFGKKKLSADKVAQALVHNLVDSAEQSFPDVAGFINDSPEFERNPKVDGKDYGKFLMVIAAGNFAYMPPYFQGGEEREIMQCAVRKLAPVYEMSEAACEQKIKEYRDFMSRVNHPSKNVLYAMSKGVFFKYGLNEFQNEYFRAMNTPNPIFLKNLDEIMKNFLWDWDVFNERYRVVADVA